MALFNCRDGAGVKSLLLIIGNLKIVKRRMAVNWIYKGIYLYIAVIKETSYN
jgi:hypothetical protein